MAILFRSAKTVLLLVLLSVSTSIFGKGDNAFTAPDSTKNTPKPWDRFSVSLGGFFAGYNSGLTLGSEQLGLGVVLNLEKALGLEVSSWALRGKMNYRYGKTKKHGLTFGYFQINRRAFKTLNKELEIGNTIIPIGVEVESRFNYTIINAKYDYSFYQDDRISLGASVGLFVMPISFSLEVSGDKASSADVVAPLPVIGLRSDFLITPKVFYRQSFELLYLAFDGFTGSVFDVDVSIEYRPITHFGLGLGMNYSKLELTSKGQQYPNIDFTGIISSGYTGVYLFGKYIL